MVRLLQSMSNEWADSPVCEACLMALPPATPPIPAEGGPPIALVKGGGELGTAVALALWRASWRVAVSELLQPTVLRRQLSLADAAFTGAVTHDGVRALRVTSAAETVILLQALSAIP